jgi:hypothetical protein
MATESSAYLLRNNILRYEGLLKNPDTTAAKRRTLGTLIAEAQAILHRAEIEETGR